MKSLFKIILIVFLFITTGCSVNSSYIEREEAAKVIAIGYGDSTGSSLNDAFREATRKAFGSQVNSEQIVENRTLIKDETIVTDAERDSRIKRYKILEQSRKGDIYTTKIEALVIATHLTKVSLQRRMVREEWNQLVSGPNPIVGVGQVGMKIGGEIKNYWVSWFGKPTE